MAAWADYNTNLQEPRGLSGLGVPGSTAWAQEHMVLPALAAKCPALGGSPESVTVM